VDTDLPSILGTIAQVSAGLLAVTVTLVAVVPALVEIVRAREPQYFRSIAANSKLKRSLRALSYTIGLFGAGTLLALIDMAFKSVAVAWVAGALCASGLFVLAYASYSIASTTREFT